MDLIGPHTLKSRDGTEVDFMCLIMIEPKTSWLKIIELLVVKDSAIPMVHGDARAHWRVTLLRWYTLKKHMQ